VIPVDDGIRHGTAESVLAKLKPVFKKDVTTTVGIAELFLLTLLLQPEVCLSVVKIFYEIL
jgi:hypothetical protein